jgi:hypothetical protein
MLLTYGEFVETASKAGLDGHHFSPGEKIFLGYVPITWGDSPRTTKVSEADDFKEVGPFPASSVEEAQWMLRHRFGDGCALEQFIDGLWEAVSA